MDGDLSPTPAHPPKPAGYREEENCGQHRVGDKKLGFGQMVLSSQPSGVAERQTPGRICFGVFHFLMRRIPGVITHSSHRLVGNDGGKYGKY